MNIAIFASGNGSNFEAIVKAVKRGYIKAKISLVICDSPQAGVFKRAKKLKIPASLIDHKKYSSINAFESTIKNQLKQNKINLIVLAGFMRLLSPNFIRSYKNKIINIHPAILPAFKGVDSIKRAFDYGCKVTGVTVHFVDEKIDHGPIILQVGLNIASNTTLAKLKSKVHSLEHKLFPLAIKLFCEKKLRIYKRQVQITK